MHKLGILFFWAALTSGVAAAQTDIVLVPEGSTDSANIHRGSVDSNGNLFGNPFDQPATFKLMPKSANGPTGKIWVRASGAGLVIWGRVATPVNSLHWPQQKSEMLSSNHVEVWVAAAPDVPMPPIGWGNQFGEQDLNAAEDCTKTDAQSDAFDGCAAWFTQQVRYRAQLKRLFVRQWFVADDERHDFEDYASTAYAALQASNFKEHLPAMLQPKADDGFRSEINVTSQPSATRNQPAAVTGYQFHILIPYSAFPPARELELRDLWLMVDVFNAAEPGHKMGPYSSTSPQRKWGEPATFNHLRLAEPHVAMLAPCEYKLTEPDVYGESHPAWYFPAASGELRPYLIASDFALINSSTGYEYAPTSVSPEAQEFRHFSKNMDGRTVCGPDLAYVYAKTHSSSSFEIDEKALNTRLLGDGWLLLRSGPTMTIQNPKFGSGQCGACSVEMLQMYAISPDGQIQKALDLSDRVNGDPGDALSVDYAFSDDWSRITYYAEMPDDPNDFSDTPKTHATSVAYCLQNHGYQQCSQSDKTKMPDPPNFPAPKETQ